MKEDKIPHIKLPEFPRNGESIDEIIRGWYDIQLQWVAQLNHIIDRINTIIDADKVAGQEELDLPWPPEKIRRRLEIAKAEKGWAPSAKLEIKLIEETPCPDDYYFDCEFKNGFLEIITPPEAKGYWFKDDVASPRMRLAINRLLMEAGYIWKPNHARKNEKDF